MYKIILIQWKKKRKIILIELKKKKEKNYRRKDEEYNKWVFKLSIKYRVAGYRRWILNYWEA